jgi:hypothetical protein
VKQAASVQKINTYQVFNASFAYGNCSFLAAISIDAHKLIVQIDDRDQQIASLGSAQPAAAYELEHGSVADSQGIHNIGSV